MPDTSTEQVPTLVGPDTPITLDAERARAIFTQVLNEDAARNGEVNSDYNDLFYWLDHSCFDLMSIDSAADISRLVYQAQEMRLINGADVKLHPTPDAPARPAIGYDEAPDGDGGVYFVTLDVAPAICLITPFYEGRKLAQRTGETLPDTMINLLEHIVEEANFLRAAYFKHTPSADARARFTEALSFATTAKDGGSTDDELEHLWQAVHIAQHTLGESA